MLLLRPPQPLYFMFTAIGMLILDQNMFMVKYFRIGSSAHKVKIDAFMFIDYGCEKGTNEVHEMMLMLSVRYSPSSGCNRS